MRLAGICARALVYQGRYPVQSTSFIRLLATERHRQHLRTNEDFANQTAMEADMREHVFVVLLSCTLLAVQPAGGFPQPSLQLTPKCQAISEYFDSVTGSCEPCREICELAHIKRTQQECETQCGDYVLASKCTSDQYYDTVVHSCAPCSELCDNFYITKTRDDCIRQCPDYATTRLPSNMSDTLNGNSSTGKHDPSSKSDVGLTIAIVTIVCAVVVVGVTLAAVVTVVYRPDKCCWRTGQVVYTPVQEGSPTSSITKPIPCAADEVKQLMTALVTNTRPG